jgi:hypothetical protein
VAEVLDRRRRREAEHAELMRAHEASVAAARAAAERDKAAAASSAAPTVSRGKICPTCGERFDGRAEFCGKDGTMLVLLN